MQLLLITGPAGVGKSTVNWEMGAQLADARIAHAVIESDELDRVFPKPTSEELERIRPGAADISGVNLAAVWSTYRSLGHSRLIMSGVMLHLQFDLRWIVAAIPDAHPTIVRLLASDDTLTERLNGREIGSGREGQITRSLRQSAFLARQDSTGLLVVPTDGKTPQQIAMKILQEAGWLAG